MGVKKQDGSTCFLHHDKPQLTPAYPLAISAAVGGLDAPFGGSTLGKEVGATAAAPVVVSRGSALGSTER